MEDMSSDKYEMVNHPSHYNDYSVECIEMMERIYGPANVSMWCELTAFKYRFRLGKKPDNPIEQDLAKERWYLEKMHELKNKMSNEKDT